MKQFLLMIAVAGLLNACQANEQATTPPHAPEQVQATTATARLVRLPVWLTTGGSVTSDHRVSVSSRLSGYIRGLRLREGQHVKKGDLLFRIDPVDVNQALNQAKADAAHALAEKKRYEALLKSQAVTRQQYDQVALRYTLARSRVKQAANQLHYTDVRAALDGVVVSKLMHNGDLASPGQVVLVIENPRQLLVETHVSDGQVRFLHEGDSAELRFSGQSRPVQARINHIVEDDKPASHQFLVKLAMLNTEGIRPGMFAHVRFRQAEREALMIPQAAIVHRNGLSGVYVVDDKGLLHYQLVRLGERQGDQVEITAGLDSGARLVSPMQSGVRSGMQLIEAAHG